MKKLYVVVVITVIAVAAPSSFAAATCCSTEEHGQKKSASASVADDGVVTREQIDETIAALVKMKERIPPGREGVSIRELMALQMEDLKKSPEYAKMSAEDRKRLDAAIDAARHASVEADRENVAKRPVLAPRQDAVEISEGTRAFFIPKQRASSAGARKGRR